MMHHDAEGAAVRSERGCENQRLRPQPQGQLKRLRLERAGGRAAFLRTSVSVAPGEGRSSKEDMLNLGAVGRSYIRPAGAALPVVAPRRNTPTTTPSMMSGSSRRLTRMGSKSGFSGSSHTVGPSCL